MVYESIPGGARINIPSANEHVTDIEHQIRVVNERSIAVNHSLPFNKIHKLLTIYIVFTVFRMLKYLSFKGGVSVILIPKTIMSGETLHYKLHLGLNIGQFCQVNEYEYPKNSQVPWTKVTICLGPSGNKQEAFWFMSLNLVKISPEGVGKPSWCLTLS